MKPEAPPKRKRTFTEIANDRFRIAVLDAVLDTTFQVDGSLKVSLNENSLKSNWPNPKLAPSSEKFNLSLMDALKLHYGENCGFAYGITKGTVDVLIDQENAVNFIQDHKYYLNESRQKQ